MCNVGDDNFDDIESSKYMPAKEKVSPFSKCNKCREQTPIVLLRSKDKYCKECFIAGTIHKFKALLGKHKLIRPNDRVLVVHKCGHASTAILHFIRTGLDLETHKKLRFEPIILFLEDHADLTPEERKELVKKVESEAHRFNLPIYFTSVVELISDKSVGTAVKDSSNLLEITENDKLVIEEFVIKQKSVTNKQDFLNIVRHQFMVDIAKHLKCKFIFTLEISNDVASQLLSDISLGRGSHVTLNTGFCDFRDEDVKILRPLRLFDTKELAFYNYLNNLEPVTFRIFTNNSHKSVQQLIKKFVDDLQNNYPATVTTVVKTGDKLALNSKITNKCDFCKAPTDEENSELSSAESTRFSHWVSTQASDNRLNSQERYADVLGAFDNLACDDYCFACKRLMNSM